MADITMCRDKDCPIKSKCWRYLAPANEYAQSIFAESPFDYEKLNCEHFWRTLEK